MSVVDVLVGVWSVDNSSARIPHGLGPLGGVILRKQLVRSNVFTYGTPY